MRVWHDGLILRKSGRTGLWWRWGRWAGELTIKGNELVIGKDEGWFAITGGAYVGGKFSKDLKERIIRINTSED